MPVQKASGEENLRADPSVKSGSATASPSGSGKDAGGTANLGAKTEVKSASANDTPSGSPDRRPSGLQSFDRLSGDPK